MLRCLIEPQDSDNALVQVVRKMNFSGVGSIRALRMMRMIEMLDLHSKRSSERSDGTLQHDVVPGL